MTRWYRPLAVGLTVVLVVVACVLARYRWGAVTSHGAVAIDYQTVLEFARRMLTTGSMYLPSQLAGPFDPQPVMPIPQLPSMYPPTTAYLFVPFLVLPSVIWWVIPLTLLMWVVRSWRPAPWTWPILAGILAISQFVTTVFVGNTEMWLAAVVAAGLKWGWGGPLVLLKPSLVPFAIAGIRSRAWWIAAAVMAVVSLPLVAEYLRYAQVLENAQTSLLYSLASVPGVMIPVIAWAGRRPGGLDLRGGSDEPHVVDSKVALTHEGAEVVHVSRYVGSGWQLGIPPMQRLMIRTAGRRESEAPDSRWDRAAWRRNLKLRNWLRQYPGWFGVPTRERRWC